MAQSQKNPASKAHKQNQLDFAELTYAEQAKSINAQILNLEAAIKAHARRSAQEGKANPKEKSIKTLENLIFRLEKLK